MATQKQLQTDFQTGQTVYYIIRDANTAFVFNTLSNAFEVYSSANFANYPVAAGEQGTSGFYTTNMPVAVPAGSYAIVAKQQIGGSPAETDPSIGWGNVQWVNNTLGIMTLLNLLEASMSNFEGSAALQSLCGAILKLTAKFEQDNNQTVATTHKTTGGTFMTQTITKNNNLKPVQTLDIGS